jgi:hypothetical protein
LAAFLLVIWIVLRESKDEKKNKTTSPTPAAPTPAPAASEEKATYDSILARVPEQNRQIFRQNYESLPDSEKEQTLKDMDNVLKNRGL